MLATSQVYKPKSKVNLASLKLLVPYLGMFALALLLWLPFSFKTTGLVEELGVTQLFDRGERLFFITPSSAISSHSTRPFEVFFHQLAYLLDPNSYFYYNIFQMLFIWGEMVVVFWIVLHYLPGKKLVAFFIGILFAIYPSEHGLFLFRIIHAHSATLAYLLAFNFLIVYFKNRGIKSGLALAVAVFLLLFSTMQYQIALPVALVTPFFLLYFASPNRRMIIGSVIWYMTLGFAILYALWINQQATSTTYELGLASSGTQSTIQSLIDGMFKALVIGYERQITGWLRPINNLPSVSLFFGYWLLGIGIVTGVGAWIIWRQKREGLPWIPVSLFKKILFIVAGILFFAAGLAIYLPIPSHATQDIRIYLLAKLGSTVVLVISLYWLSSLAPKYKEIIFMMLFLPFWAIALQYAFTQHQYYVNFSLIVQNGLQQIVAQAPEFKVKSNIILIDQEEAFNNEYLLHFGYYFDIVLRYLYSEPAITAYYCIPGQMTARQIKCNFDSEGVQIVYDPSVLVLIPNITPPKIMYKDALIFVVEPNYKIKLLSSEEGRKQFNNTTYNPQLLITGTTPPFRTKTFFSCDPALSCYREEPAVNSYNLPDNGEIGFGWRGPEINNGNVFRWSVSTRTSVNVNLLADSDLVLKFRMLNWLDEAVVNTLKLSINGQNIPLTHEEMAQGGPLYSAIIPRTVLAGFPSHTQLIFTIDKLTPVPNAPDLFLGWAISGLTIRPVQP